MLDWMAWTSAGAIFFIGIGVSLAVMTVWELRSPSVARQGFLPMPTTRGDRFFIALLLGAFIHLLWLGFFDAPPWPASVISVAALIALVRYG